MTTPEHNIEVEPLGGACTGEWARRVFADKSCSEHLPDSARNSEWVETLIRRMEYGEVLGLLPGVNGVAAGLYWAAPADGGIAVVHQFVMPEYRKGWLPVRIAKACAAHAFDLLPDVSHFLGFTPEHPAFRGALLTAERAGFTRVGTIPAYYDWRGLRLTCAILAKWRQ